MAKFAVELTFNLNWMNFHKSGEGSRPMQYKYIYNVEGEDRDAVVRKICKDEESAKKMIDGIAGTGARKFKYSVKNPQFLSNFEFSDWFKDNMRKHFGSGKDSPNGLNINKVFPPESKDKDFKDNGLRAVSVKTKADSGKWTQLLEGKEFVCDESNHMKDLTSFIYESLDIVY